MAVTQGEQTRHHVSAIYCRLALAVGRMSTDAHRAFYMLHLLSAELLHRFVQYVSAQRILLWLIILRHVNAGRHCALAGLDACSCARRRWSGGIVQTRVTRQQPLSALRTFTSDQRSVRGRLWPASQHRRRDLRCSGRSIMLLAFSGILGWLTM